ncbi:MAG: hypothetical protein FWD48_08050 [Oscillospiraceae bacterium]|nr:hypothetical protein [Oscillospiraceae bacterium]
MRLNIKALAVLFSLLLIFSACGETADVEAPVIHVPDTPDYPPAPNARRPAIIVNDVIYLIMVEIDIEIDESDYLGRTTSVVHLSEVPTENGQSNYVAEGTPYAEYEDGIVLLIAGKWMLFEAYGGQKQEQQPEKTLPPLDEYLSPLELLGGYEITDDEMVLIDYSFADFEYNHEVFSEYIYGTWEGMSLRFREVINFTVNDENEYFLNSGRIRWVNDSVFAFGFSNSTISDGFYWIDTNEPDKMYFLASPHWYDGGSDEFTKLSVGYIDRKYRTYTGEMHQGVVFIETYTRQ